MPREDELIPLEAENDEDIDFSDIPDSTVEELAAAVGERERTKLAPNPDNK